MLRPDHFAGRVVLVTGGTRGIGRATGLALGRYGARVVLTHRWGSADEDALRAEFEAAGAEAPLVVEADASRPEDTRRLMETLRRHADRVDVLVSNVCAVSRVESLEDHSERALLRTLDYSSWPLVGYLQALDAAFAELPRHVVVSSSDGPDTHYPGYDYVALSKAVLETLVRYLAVTLRPRGVLVNALRSRMVLTESFDEMFGPERRALFDRFPEFAVRPEDVAHTALALCSGAFDAMSGEIVTVDRGARFLDNTMTLGAAWAEAAS